MAGEVERSSGCTGHALAGAESLGRINFVRQTPETLLRHIVIQDMMRRDLKRLSWTYTCKIQPIGTITRVDQRCHAMAIIDPKPNLATSYSALDRLVAAPHATGLPIPNLFVPFAS